MTLAIACTFDQLSAPETPRPKRVRSVTPTPRETPPPRQDLSSLFAFEPLAPSAPGLASDTRAPAGTAGASMNNIRVRDCLENLSQRLGEQHDRWR
ncbi:hypothetical protein [Pseudomonas sp. FEN]|uniref:hypothetical protein n=1 Tax=Pseudomonas sp. FEN TaxID=2767468 RepID=UPI00174C0E48|nr:hypothetical protein [Pseudomonas sp. FEN]